MDLITTPENSGEKQYRFPNEIPIVPLKDLVVFPTMIVTVFIQNAELVKVMEESMKRDEVIGVIAQKNAFEKVPPLSNLYDIGTAVAVLQVIHGNTPEEAMILIEGISRFKLVNVTQEIPYILGQIETIQSVGEGTTELQAALLEMKSLIHQASVEGKTLPKELMLNLENILDVDQVADLACSYLSLDIKKKQELLSILDPRERVVKIIEFLNKEILLIQLRKKIHTDVSKELSKNEKDFLLRQELKAIKKELGEKDEEFGGFPTENREEIEELQKRIDEANLPPDNLKIAQKELNRLKKIFPFSPEFGVARTYLEWLCDMPWGKISSEKIDVKKARAILDKDHYGLEKIKERILEYLAVGQLKGNSGATILCFVGPPGVGKTSLGKSIAKALGKNFIHTSLGGIRDEADIRGHRRTYVGALPGRIIQSIKRSGTSDPVFMLDEVDKIGKDFQGDPAAALLETLDPEQNHAFTDHYIDLPFDLSKVFFILTANTLDTIPPALLDRMETIEIAGYTEEEKIQITKKYLLPKQIELNGLTKLPFVLTDEAISKIIRYYTDEAGLRELERQIAALCRKIAKEWIEKKTLTKKIGVREIEKYLGIEKYYQESQREDDVSGVATGLAWTPTGGDIIFIEASKMKGSKNLILTGSLGEVMQESARAALSYVRSRAKDFDIKDQIFEKSDIHIHVPEGATPKDGPSAGITIATALVSLLTGKKVRRDTAMTGEITLTGRILPIGGLKEKLLAAKRARIKQIVIPEKNAKDLLEIPKNVLKNLQIHTVKSLDEALEIALVEENNE